MLALWLTLLVALAPAGPRATTMHHPDWEWRTLHTEHFAIHFARSSDAAHPLHAEETARRVAAVADPLWLRMGDVLDWFPIEPLTVVVVDDTDALRAWAWPLRGAVVISAHPGFELPRTRGRGDPVLDVFAHELAHVFTHKRLGAMSERAGLGAEATAHLEVDGLAVGAVLPVGPAVPQWWSEGAAEYLAARVGHGWWSAGRAATLRTSVAEDRLLSWAELQVSQDKADIGDGERAYQQGHAFFRWLEAEYGPEFFARLHAIAAQHHHLDLARALRQATGEAPAALYRRHLEALEADVWAQVRAIEARGRVEGMELWRWPMGWQAVDLDGQDEWRLRPRRERERLRGGTGSWNLYAQYASDGAWLGEHRSGWVRVRRAPEGIWEALAPDGVDRRGVAAEWAENQGLDLWIPSWFGSGFSFVPGEDAVVVAAADPPRGLDLDGRTTSRLYRVDLRRVERRDGPALDPRLRRHTTPIEGSERGFDPAVSADGQRLAYVRARGSATDLVVSALDGSDPRVLAPAPQAWLSGPSWSPDGGQIVVAAYHAWRVDLWAVTLATGTWRRLTDDAPEQADPWWGPDGIYFAADSGALWDIFRLDPQTGQVHRITRVTGAAATPSLTPDGHLLYGLRTAHGWKTMGLRREAFVEQDASTGLQVARSEPTDLTYVPPASDAADRAYQAMPSTLPLALAPALRLDVDPAGPALMGGGWLVTRDPAEFFEAAVRGMVGTDQAVYGALTARLAAPELTLWGRWEDDARVILAPPAREERVTLGAVGLATRWELSPDRLALVGEGLFRRLAWDTPLLPGAGARPWSNASVGSLGVELGHLDPDPSLLWSGGRLLLLGSVGVSRDLQGLRAPAGWTRGIVDGQGSLRVDRSALEAGVLLAAIGQEVPVQDALRLGGDAPSAWRLGTVEPVFSLPGFAPRSLAAEQAAVVRVGWTLSVAEIRRRVGPVYLDEVGLRLGADGGVLGVHGEPAVPVGDVVGAVRWVSVFSDQPWNGEVRVARGVGGAEARAEDPLDPWRWDRPLRVVVGVGTGW